MRLRHLTPLGLLLLAACDSYTPDHLYMADTPDCATWQEGSTFKLPRGISVSTSPPVMLPDGGAEFTLVYILPSGERARYVTRGYNITSPHGPVIARAEMVTFYQRATNSPANIVYPIEKVPDMLVAGATSDDTIWRVRLRVKDKLPQRFDLVSPEFEIATRKYPVRTFTYRYFPERKAFGLCS